MVGALLVMLWLGMVTLGSGSGKDVACDGSARLPREELIWGWRKKTSRSDF